MTNLQELMTAIKDFETNAGSHMIVDYRNGSDPLKNTHFGTMLKHVGADVKLIGASGQQDYQINSMFAKGATR